MVLYKSCTTRLFFKNPYILFEKQNLLLDTATDVRCYLAAFLFLLQRLVSVCTIKKLKICTLVNYVKSYYLHYFTAFAFGDSYIFLFVTRLLQGAASAITAVTGMIKLWAVCDKYGLVLTKQTQSKNKPMFNKRNNFGVIYCLNVRIYLGLGLLAATYTNEEERGKVIGIAIGGISLGVIGTLLHPIVI